MVKSNQNLSTVGLVLLKENEESFDEYVSKFETCAEKLNRTRVFSILDLKEVLYPIYQYSVYYVPKNFKKYICYYLVLVNCDRK